MKYVCCLLALSACMWFVPNARAQVSLYGAFSESMLTNPLNTNYLTGGTVGFLFHGTTLARHLDLSADVQGRFLNRSSQKLNGVSLGPRLTLPIGHGFAPYAGAAVGFARYYSNGSNQDPVGPTSDATLQISGGLAKRISPRLDATVDYAYEQLYAYGGEYNPKTFSAGVILHFTKR